MLWRFWRKILWPSAEVLALGLLVSAAAAETPDSSRREALRHLVLHDCGSCHGMRLNGGLGKGLRPGDLEGLESPAVAEMILRGVPGTPMPPWEGLLTPEEAEWIARKLKTGSWVE